MKRALLKAAHSSSAATTLLHDQLASGTRMSTSSSLQPHLHQLHQSSLTDLHHLCRRIHHLHCRRFMSQLLTPIFPTSLLCPALRWVGGGNKAMLLSVRHSCQSRLLILSCSLDCGTAGLQAMLARPNAINGGHIVSPRYRPNRFNLSCLEIELYKSI